MTKNIMKRAHEIRRQAVEKWNFPMSEFPFSECLKMAWAGEEVGVHSTQETVRWQTKDGRDIKYSISLLLSKVINADGDKVEVSICEKKEEVTIAGKKIYGSIVDPSDAAKKLGAVKQYGSLCILPDNYDKIQAAQMVITSHPSWVAKQEALKDNEDDYIQLRDRRNANGYCNKCHSYCYGDCGY